MTAERELRLRRDGLSWRLLDGEVVAVDARGSLYLGANRTGTLLWQRLAAGATRAALVAELVQAFAIEPEAADADVGRFLEQLGDRGMLDDAAS